MGDPEFVADAHAGRVLRVLDLEGHPVTLFGLDAGLLSDPLLYGLSPGSGPQYPRLRHQRPMTLARSGRRHRPIRHFFGYPTDCASTMTCVSLSFSALESAGLSTDARTTVASPSDAQKRYAFAEM